jgi:hypothetical protein
MEWLIPLQGQVVGLDTAPLIYFIEQNEIYLQPVRDFKAGDNINVSCFARSIRHVFRSWCIKCQFYRTIP